MGVTVHSAEEAAIELVKAAFAHGGVMNNKRIAQYSDLLGRSRLSLPDALTAIAKLDVIDGLVEVKPGKTIKAWSVIHGLVNMCASYVWHTLAFANHNLRKKEIAGKLDRFFSLFTGQEARIVSVARILPIIIRIDRRWNMVLPEHVERIAREARTFRRHNVPDELALNREAVNAWVLHVHDR